uniref:Capsid assembly protein n=1 Tax=viral metagenome TaxID=1070528 RepID=A0A6M3M0W1_9ZZZZ
MPDPITGAPGAPEPGSPEAIAAAAAAEGKSFIDMVPEEYRDKPWVKENTETPENFFKFVDNQNALVGKKGVILPEVGAPQEKFDEYYKALGRPDTAEGYELTPSEELKDIKRDPQMVEGIKKVYHTAGVPKDMAVKISQGIDALLFERGKEQILKEQAGDKAFDEFNKTVFGENKDARVAQAQKILKEDLPKEALPGLDKLDGEALSVVAVIADSLYAKYGQEDRFRGGAGAGAGTKETMDDLSTQQRELMGKEGFDIFNHPDHAGLQAKNKIIMDKMRAIKA